jgi:membrane-associated PAP2 superfamily phosphatase
VHAACAEQEAPVSDVEDGDGSAEEVRACLFSLLQRKCPELRITCNALGMLEGLLNEVGCSQVKSCM